MSRHKQRLTSFRHRLLNTVGTLCRKYSTPVRSNAIAKSLDWQSGIAVSASTAISVHLRVLEQYQLVTAQRGPADVVWSLTDLGQRVANDPALVGSLMAEAVEAKQ